MVFNQNKQGCEDRQLKKQNRMESLLFQFPETGTYWNGEPFFFMLSVHMDLTGTKSVHLSYATSSVKFHWNTAQNIKMCQHEPSVKKRKPKHRNRKIASKVCLNVYLLMQAHSMYLVLDQNYRYVTQLKNNWFIILC